MHNYICNIYYINKYIISLYNKYYGDTYTFRNEPMKGNLLKEFTKGIYYTMQISFHWFIAKHVGVAVIFGGGKLSCKPIKLSQWSQLAFLQLWSVIVGANNVLIFSCKCLLCLQRSQRAEQATITNIKSISSYYNQNYLKNEYTHLYHIIRSISIF